MLKKFKLILWVNFLYIFTLFVSSGAFAESVEKPFLWKTESQQSSYLFGTIHLADPRATTLHSSVETAFEVSDYVYTEIPLDTKDMLSQVSHLMLEGNTTLVDLVPSEYYRELRNF